MIRNNYLASSQKGFLPEVSGCIEHHFTMKELIKGIKGNKFLDFIATDIRSAYRSVPHAYIHEMLKHYYFPPRFCQLIQNMYTGLKLNMNFKDENVKIDVTVGVFEGEVLSVALFLIAFNPLLQGINQSSFAKSNGVTRNNQSMTNLTFADDANFVSASTGGAKKILGRFSDFLDWTGMKDAAEKFKAYRFVKNGTEDVKIEFEGVELENTRRMEDSYKLLGKTTFWQDPENGWKSLSKNIEDDLRKISKEKVSSKVKVEMYKLMIQTSFFFE
jgi:hypothetical protein